MEVVFRRPNAHLTAHAAVLVVARDGGRSQLHRLREPVVTLGRAPFVVPRTKKQVYEFRAAIFVEKNILMSS